MRRGVRRTRRGKSRYFEIVARNDGLPPGAGFAASKRKAVAGREAPMSTQADEWTSAPATPPRAAM
eukprot:11208753-Lingulodinium_polyedra.AAC.1